MFIKKQKQDETGLRLKEKNINSYIVLLKKGDLVSYFAGHWFPSWSSHFGSNLALTPSTL